jgi:hypothetical protein
VAGNFSSDFELFSISEMVPNPVYRRPIILPDAKLFERNFVALIQSSRAALLAEEMLSK